MFHLSRLELKTRGWKCWLTVAVTVLLNLLLYGVGVRAKSHQSVLLSPAPFVAPPSRTSSTFTIFSRISRVLRNRMLAVCKRHPLSIEGTTVPSTRKNNPPALGALLSPSPPPNVVTPRNGILTCSSLVRYVYVKMHINAQTSPGILTHLHTILPMGVTIKGYKPPQRSLLRRDNPLSSSSPPLFLSPDAFFSHSLVDPLRAQPCPYHHFWRVLHYPIFVPVLFFLPLSLDFSHDACTPLNCT